MRFELDPWGMPPDDDEAAVPEASASVSWGAGRFAVEFERREREELLMTRGARSSSDPLGRDRADRGTWGPVQDDVAALAVEPVGGEPELRRLEPVRHPSVPRPPQEPAAEPARSRRRRRRRAEPAPSAPQIPAHEAARMSPAARRLYGLPEQPPAGR